MGQPGLLLTPAGRAAFTRGRGCSTCLADEGAQLRLRLGGPLERARVPACEHKKKVFADDEFAKALAFLCALPQPLASIGYRNAALVDTTG
jgi:hypothetical protein